MIILLAFTHTHVSQEHKKRYCEEFWKWWKYCIYFYVPWKKKVIQVWNDMKVN